MRSPLAIIIMIGLAVTCSGCGIAGSQYYSGQNGPVDCASFPIQSERNNLLSDNDKSCIVQTANEVQYAGTAYIRSFKYKVSDSEKIGYTNVVLQVALINTIIRPQPIQTLLAGFDQVKRKSSEWEKIAPVTSNGRVYELHRFHLSEFGNSCIGF